LQVLAEHLLRASQRNNQMKSST